LDHVEIEGDTATFELRRIHRAHMRVDAGAFEPAHESERQSLLVTRRGEDFKTEWPPAGEMGEVRALETVAGLAEEGEGPRKRGAIAARPVGHRRSPGAGHDVGTHDAGKRCKQVPLARISGHAMCGEIAAVEIAGGALVAIEEIGVVDPLEI